MHTLSTEWVYSALNLSNVMSNMTNVQEHLVDSTSPLQRSVYLITDSQCDASGLTKADFAKVILDSWKACYMCRVVQWVASEELQQNGDVISTWR